LIEDRVYRFISGKYPLLRRAAVVLLWTSILYVGYQLTNRFQIFEPHSLILFEFEKNIPFLAWTVLPYLLLVGGMYLPIFINSPAIFMKSLLATGFAVAINYSIFLFFPTVYPRPPTPEITSFASVIYQWLVSIDTPANCFPSGHVSVPGIGFWYLVQQRKKHAWVYIIIFILLVTTVLTTKQHYLIDIFGGLFTAFIGILLAERFYSHRTAQHDVIKKEPRQ